MTLATDTERETQQPEVLPYRTFDTQVVALRRLSPSFLRVTVTGDDLRHFADNGLDQRIKLILPLAGSGDGGFEHFPDDPEWFLPWRELPEEQRNPVRTYTVRAVRQSFREIDVDLVLHGDAGPASRWANRAAIGDRILVVGPDARFDGPHGGLVWNPPVGAEVLLVGDETAVPAITRFLRTRRPGTPARVILEVGPENELVPVPADPATEVTVVVRGTGTLADALDRLGEDERPAGGVLGFVAAESGIVPVARDLLLERWGLPAEALIAKGYWRRD